MRFGIRHAPFIFDRLGRSIRVYLHLRGITIIIYLDYILILASSFDKCLRDAQFVIDLLISLGLHIKKEKCILTPNKNFFFLGYLWCTMEMKCHLPVEKLTAIQELTKEVLENQPVPLLKLMRLKGMIMATRPAVRLARAMQRGMEKQVNRLYDGTEGSAKMLINLTTQSMKEISWWLDLKIEDCWMSLRQVKVLETIRIATDAMDSAVGSGRRAIPGAGSTQVGREKYCTQGMACLRNNHEETSSKVKEQSHFLGFRRYECKTSLDEQWIFHFIFDDVRSRSQGGYWLPMP